MLNGPGFKLHSLPNVRNLWADFGIWRIVDDALHYTEPACSIGCHCRFFNLLFDIGGKIRIPFMISLDMVECVAGFHIVGWANMIFIVGWKTMSPVNEGSRPVSAFRQSNASGLEEVKARRLLF